MSPRDVVRPLTAVDLIIAARRYYGPNQIGAYNTYALGFEADLIMVSRAGYATEFEVKVSMADFRADAHKEAKHKQLSSGETCTWKRGRCWPIGTAQPIKHFYYVAPKPLAERIQAELPAHAGLLAVDQLAKYGIEERLVVKAPQLKCRKVSPGEMHHLLLSMYYKAWQNVRMRSKASPSADMPTLPLGDMEEER